MFLPQPRHTFSFPACFQASPPSCATACSHAIHSTHACGHADTFLPTCYSLPTCHPLAQAFLTKLRDDLLASNGVKPAQVKLVPLPANTATCEWRCLFRLESSGWCAGMTVGGTCGALAAAAGYPPSIRACRALLASHSLLLAALPLPSAAQDVGRTISDYAAKANADAVVIGSRGLGAFRRRVLVSAAEQQAHQRCSAPLHAQLSGVTFRNMAFIQHCIARIGSALLACIRLLRGARGLTLERPCALMRGAAELSCRSDPYVAYACTLQGLVGLGSVSDYVAHHAPCTGAHRPGL